MATILPSLSERNPYEILHVAPLFLEIDGVKKDELELMEAMRMTHNKLETILRNEHRLKEIDPEERARLRHEERKIAALEKNAGNKEKIRLITQSIAEASNAEKNALQEELALAKKEFVKQQRMLEYETMALDAKKAIAILTLQIREAEDPLREKFLSLLGSDDESLKGKDVWSLRSLLIRKRKTLKKNTKKNAKELAFVRDILKKARPLLGSPLRSKREKYPGSLEALHSDIDQAEKIVFIFTSWLAKEEEIRRQHKLLSEKFHPDRSAGNERVTKLFSEVRRAFIILTTASPKEKIQLARNLLMGQETGLWTEEKRAVYDKIALELAPLFVMIDDPFVDFDRCEECHGSSHIVIQEEGDSIPTPRICAECNGTGYIPHGIAEYKKALTAFLKKP